MTVTEEHRLNAGAIRRDYLDGLNATQESSLELVFHWADAQGLALLDLADLRSTIAFLVSDDAAFVNGAAINIGGGISMH